MKKKLLTLLISVCLILMLMPLTKMNASAATTQADRLIEHARSHVGDMYNTFDDRQAFTTDWCSQFIQHCAAKAGLSKIIPTSGCAVVRDMAENVVNTKNGKITFVVKEYYDAKKTQYDAERVFYDANYCPRKGDLIIFGQYSYNNYPHIGIVASDSTEPRSNVHVIEGNTDGAVYTESYVKEKTNRGGNIVAYVTPAYNDGWPSLVASNEETSGKVILSWTKHDTATKYYIYRSTSKTSGFKYIDRTAGTSYIDAGGEASYLYYYKIKAVTSEGKVLSVSDIVSRTCDCAQPKIVGISNVASTGKIKLKWKDVANADRYDIYRCVDGGTYKKMKTFSTKLNTGKTYSYINTTAKAGEKYWYKVVARNSNNIGADSASSTGWARTCDLAKPTNVKASNAAKGKIKVTWNKVEGATSYRIYRKTGKNGTYKLQYTTTKCSYNNSAVKKGKTYYYKIKAVMKKNSDATSAYSAVVYKKVR